MKEKGEFIDLPKETQEKLNDITLNLTEKIEFLKTTPLFSSVSEDIIAKIASFAEEVTCPPNTFLFHESDPGNFLYLIVNGEVELIKEGIFLRKIHQRGDCLGEMALLDDRPRSASLMAATKLHLLRINRHHFDKMLDESPQFCRELFKVLSFRLREDLNLQTEAIRQEAARANELKLASEVQRSLFPRKEIRLPHIQTSGHCELANTVGGDYYDYLIASPERIGVVIGDVMGHGFHSALFVAMVKSCLQTQIHQASSISKIMKSVSHRIEQSQTGIYITMCYVLIDFRSQTLSYANAGHPPPCHYSRRSGELEKLEPTCMPLGLVPEMGIPRKVSQRLSWDRGDLILMYSDGVTESENFNEEMFGEEKLQKLFLANVDRSAEDIKASMLSELAAHCQGKPYTDDVTLVVIKL